MKMPLWRKSGWMFRNYQIGNSAVYFSACGFYSTAIQPIWIVGDIIAYRRLFDKDLTPSDGRQPIRETI